MNKFFIFSFFAFSFIYGKSISYIGDSQSASSSGLFSKLRNSFESNGHRLTQGRAVCGAQIQDYLTGNIPGSCKYLGATSLEIKDGKVRFPPGAGTTSHVMQVTPQSDVVFVQLGDNHLNDVNVGQKAQELVKSILSSGQDCVWISPAAAADSKKCRSNRVKKKNTSHRIQTALSDPAFVKRSFGRQCTFINSYKATENFKFNNGDCLHYSDYTVWANAIKGQIETALIATDKNQVKKDGSAVSR